MTILFAMTNEAFRPANLALVGELGPAEHRKSAFALSRLAVNLGMSVGPAVGGMLAQISFPLLFIVDGVTSLVAAAILALSSFHVAVLEHERKNARPREPKPARKLALLPSALQVDTTLRVFLLGIFPVSVVFFQHESAMPLYLVRDLHFSESAYGMLFTLNTLLIIFLEIPLNSATAHWPHRRTLAVGSLLFAIGFGSLALAHTLLQVAATVAIWTFGEMILFPGMSAYISEIAPEGMQGEYMGFYMMALSLAFMAGPWIGTLALEHYGARVLWISTLFVGLVSVVLLGRLDVKAPAKHGV
jgi:MFS family permease